MLKQKYHLTIPLLVFLNGKLVAGTGVSFTENSDGGNETLTIASSVTDNSINFSIALG